MQKKPNSARYRMAMTFARQRKARVGWVCAAAGSCLAAALAGSAMRSGEAQSPPAPVFITLPQTTSTIPVVPSVPEPAVALAQASPTAHETPTALQARPGDAPARPQSSEAASQAAALLKMATALKTEVDKTTKDTLSVTVVRKAGEIEQLAHKVRLDAGKD